MQQNTQGQIGMPGFAMFSTILDGYLASHLYIYINAVRRSSSWSFAYEIAPVASLSDWRQGQWISRFNKEKTNKPYSLYPKESISLCPTCIMYRHYYSMLIVKNMDTRTSAYWAAPKPFFFGASENPYPGKLNATTWKLGWSGDAAVNNGSIFRTSRKCPGPIVHVSFLLMDSIRCTHIHGRTATE